MSLLYELSIYSKKKSVPLEFIPLAYTKKTQINPDPAQ